MRGKAVPQDFIKCSVRITPAYAGKREPPCRSWLIMKDHPRLCGEKQLVTVFDARDVGSPPPMRGKVSATANLISDFRITPAYAGKSTLTEGWAAGT